MTWQAPCSITLFEIMFELVKNLGTSPTTGHETGMQLLNIIVQILKLGGGITPVAPVTD